MAVLTKLTENGNKKTKLLTRSQCNKQLFAQHYFATYAEIKQSDWMLPVM